MFCIFFVFITSTSALVILSFWKFSTYVYFRFHEVLHITIVEYMFDLLISCLFSYFYLCVFAIGLHRQLCSLAIFLQSKTMLSTYNTETWLFYFELLFISSENKTTVVLYTPPPSLVAKQHIMEEWKKTLAKLEDHVCPSKVLTSLQYKPSPLLVQTHLPID